MTRRLKNGIILSFCELCKNTEVPEIFANWSIISCISACLERRCSIDQGHFTVYPNLYIVLVAGSAGRKSVSIIMTKKLSRRVMPCLHLLSQKSSPEALIGDLSGTLVACEDKSIIKENACGFAIVDELSTLIDKKAFDNGMISILTKLYDCEDLDYRTRARNLELVKEPCLTILGGSTMQWIKETVPVVAIGGGFTARVIFVYSNKRRQFVAWPERTEQERQLEQDIISDLGQVRLITGPFIVTDKAKELYCKEYVDFCSTSKLFEDPNMSGYAGRRHVMILKLAMCASASSKDSREIDELDMAIKLAKRVDQPAAVVSAVKTKADLCGLNIDAAQNPADKPLMTREELLEALAELDGVSEQARIIQLQVNKRVG